MNNVAEECMESILKSILKEYMNNIASSNV